MSRRKGVLVVVLFTFVLLTAVARADYLLVTRTATIREGPSRDATALSKPEEGATLALREGEVQNGYYPVTDPSTNRPGWIYRTFVRRYPDKPPATSVTPRTTAVTPVSCSAKKPMKIHFYDVGQALAALVDLPDGRHILVDSADTPTRPGCGIVCRDSHDHLMESLARDLNGAPVSMLWSTHQHSDHIGGAPDVLNKFRVEVYVDNGQDLGKTQVKRARETASARNTRVAAVNTSSTEVPIPDAGAGLKLRPIVPAAWPAACEDDANACSIGLEIQYCSSTVLFTGDAEDVEEEGLEPGRVTLLQVGHHGSDTSSSREFLAKVAPKYAVISAGRRGEGLNKTYCHPRQVTVMALTSALGGQASTSLVSFDGSVSCRKATDKNWKQIRASDRMWSTSRDGDVTLTTVGDGVFVKERE